MKAHRAAHPVEYKEAQRRYRAAHRDTLLEREREQNLKRLYGISAAEYEKLLQQQGGRCAICGRTDNGMRHTKNFHVDHNHATGEVRGLLCGPCNGVLGYAKDDPSVLLQAIAYLNRVQG